MTAMYYNEARTRMLMDAAGVDVLISGAQENLSYFAGVPTLHGCMADLVMYVVVARDRVDRPILIAPINAVDLYVQMGSWVEEVRLWGKFFIYQNDDPKVTPTADELRMKELLAQGTVADRVGGALQHTLAELNMVAARLAIDERGLIDPPVYSTFAELFPKAKITPGRQLARNIRAVKTPYEIALMREAARINDLGVRAILEAAAPGVSEKALHRIYLDTIEHEGAHSHHACIQSGSRGGLPNGEPSAKLLVPGEIVRLDFDLVFNGYYSDIARCAVVGRPSSRQVQYANAVIAGLNACRAVMRPGTTAMEVFRAGRRCGPQGRHPALRPPPCRTWHRTALLRRAAVVGQQPVRSRREYDRQHRDALLRAGLGVGACRGNYADHPKRLRMLVFSAARIEVPLTSGRRRPSRALRARRAQRGVGHGGRLDGPAVQPDRRPANSLSPGAGDARRSAARDQRNGREPCVRDGGLRSRAGNTEPRC